MEKLQSNPNSAKSMFTGSIEGLANIVAVATTFFTVPLAYGYTVPWVRTFSLRHYDVGLLDLVTFAWWITCALTIFFAARASLSTGLVIGGMALAARLL